MARLALHDVEDTQLLVRRVVARSGFKLSYHDREDVEQYLMFEAVLLARDFQPGRINKGFGCYCTVALKRKLIDFQRQRYRTRWKFKDRVYERPRPQFIEFDDSVLNRLDAIESTRAGDSTASGDEDWRGLLDDRDRYRAWDFELLGLGEVA